MSRKTYYVYIMASVSGTLYVGITNNLIRRVCEHREGLVERFTKKYGCKKLIYFEDFTYVVDAIGREKQIKGWNRNKKELLIKTKNPKWRDLSTSLEMTF